MFSTKYLLENNTVIRYNYNILNTIVTIGKESEYG